VVRWRTKGRTDGSERERAAEIQDLRLDEYSTFIGAAQEVVGKYTSGSGDAEVRAALVRLSIAQARVAFIRENAEVEEAADALVRTLGDGEGSTEQHLANYRQAADSFLAAARDEIGTTNP